MKQKNFLFALVVFFLINGCTKTRLTSSPIPYETQSPSLPNMIVTSTQSVTPTSIVITLQTTNNPSLTATDLPYHKEFPESIIEFTPVQAHNTFTYTNMPDQDLVCSGVKPQLIRFSPQIQISELPFSSSCLSASLNGKWLGHCSGIDEQSGRELTITSFDNIQQFQTRITEDILWFPNYLWINDHQMAFILEPQNIESGLHPMFFIDPFTGDSQTLESNYPDLKGFYLGPLGTMHFNISDVVYDPSLNYVVYRVVDEDHFRIRLWDRQGHQSITEVIDFSLFPGYPLWSPNGESIALATQPIYEVDEDQIKQDWFLVQLNGAIERLTSFGDYFRQAVIFSGNWSPDGQRIAFWLLTDPSPCPGQQLAILEVSTRKVIDYCIPGSINRPSPPPIWSPDSKFLALWNYDNDQTAKPGAVIFNIEKLWAVYVSDISYPVGWLLRAP